MPVTRLLRGLMGPVHGATGCGRDRKQRLQRRKFARRRRRATTVRPAEILEARMLLAGDALVEGTEFADTIWVDHSSSETIVTVNGRRFTYADSDVASLTIRSYGGPDTITIDRTGMAPLTVDAGEGADTVNLGTGRFYRLNANLITINGGGNPQDLLEIRDEASVGDDRPYRISSGAFTRGEDPTVAVFEGFSDILLRQNEESTITEVGPVAADVRLAIADLGIDDQDSYEVGHDAVGGLASIQGTLLLGGNDNDHVTLDDSGSTVADTEYVLSASDPSGPAGAGNFSVLDLHGTGRIELYGSGIGEVLDVDLYTSTGDNSVMVKHTLPDVKWNIRDSGGVDTVVVGNGNYAWNIRGEVAVIGQGDDDTLIVDDRNDAAGIEYVDGEPSPRPFFSEKHDYAFAADTFEKSETFWRLQPLPGAENPETVSAPRLTFDDLAEFELWASSTTGNEFGSGDFGTTFTVNGVASGTSLKIIDEVGDSQTTVGDGEYLANIHGPVTIEGGAGRNVLTIDDRSFVRAPLGANTSYRLDTEDVGLAEYGTFAIGVRLIEFPPPPERFTPELRFTRTEEVTLEGSRAADRFNVLRTPNNVPIVLHGRDGEDTFNIGNGDFDTNIRGDVAIHGGAGDDALVIDDENDTGDDDYIFSAEGILSAVGTFTKTSTLSRVSMLRFDDLDSVELGGSEGDNVFTVDRMQPSTDYRLYGNGGVDAFHIDVAGQVSDVFVSGGAPETPPGDSLRVTGLGLFTATNTADPTDTSGGTVTTSSVFSSGGIRNTITYTGLEPVMLDGFDTVTMVTPRSYDVIDVVPEEDGWSKVSGVSGHPLLLLPFESLSFRNVGHVILDTASRDGDPVTGTVNGVDVILPPLPNDSVTIHPSALDARGLESFSVVTGTGVNQVFDNTLEAPVATPIDFFVDGTGGLTHVQTTGSTARVEVEQFANRHAEFAAFDENGQVLHRGGYNSTALLMLPDVRDSLRAIGEDMDRKLTETTHQLIEGPDLTTVAARPASEGSRLDIVAVGKSRVELEEILFPRAAISGCRSAGPQPPSSPDEITIAPLLAGPQPEPPRMRIECYGPEDRVNLVAPEDAAGLPLPTDFSLGFDASDNEQIELLVHTGGGEERIGFTVETGEMGVGPALGLLGDPTAEHRVNAVRHAAVDLPMLHPLQITLAGIASLNVAGSTDDESLSVTPMSDGRLQIDSLNKHDVGRDLHFLADSTLTNLISDGFGGEDSFEMDYPEPDFRNFHTDLQGTESISLAPTTDGGIVNQFLTPNTGGIQANSFSLQHDDTPTNFQVDASKLGVSIEADAGSSVFTRDLSFRYAYTGSEGVFTIDGVTFEGEFSFELEQQILALNESVFEISNSTFYDVAIIDIVGGNQGTSNVIIEVTNVDGIFAVGFFGVESSLLMELLTDASSFIDATVENPGGTNQIETQGNVTVKTSALAGTGIDPTPLFTTFVVTNTNDSGPGSLRSAIESANASANEGLSVVTFQIPDTDPNFVDVDAHLPGGDAAADVFVISPETELPALTRGQVVINGQSQHATTGDSNPFGPEIVLAGNLATAASAPAGLVSQYRFEGSADDVVGNNEPSATAGISFVDGRVGEGVTFQPGGYIDIPHTEELAQETFTLSAWVRPDGPGPNDDEFGSVILAKNLPLPTGARVVSVELGYSTRSNRFLFGFGNVFTEQDRIFSTATFAPGKFHHVAATYDGGTFRLYVDGELQGEKALEKTIDYDPSIPWTIGSSAAPFRGVGFPRTWNGVIDEVGIFDRPLTAGEITSLATPVTGLRLASSDNHVHGLNIQQFTADGLLVTDHGNTLTGNYVGTNATGASQAGNGADGVRIVNSSGNLVGGATSDARNVISGNSLAGVAIIGRNAGQNTVKGNYVGVGADGRTQLGQSFGVQVAGFHFTVEAGQGNVIGGTTEGDRNVISGNFQANVSLSATRGTTVQGNYIGTDATGSFHVAADPRGVTGIHVSDDKDSLIGGARGGGNLIAGQAYGIRVDGLWIPGGTERTRIEGNLIGTDATGQNKIDGFSHYDGIVLSGHVDSNNNVHPIQDVVIGGTEPGAGNVISGNFNHGIVVNGPGSQRIKIRGNKIGTDVDGVDALPNGTGVLIANAAGVVVGGTEEGAGNVVSGNAGSGISILGGSEHVVQGNYVGTAADGTTSLGNAGGVAVTNSSGNLIGGPRDDARNIISASTGGYGVVIAGAGSTGNLVERNYIGTDITGTIDLGNTLSGVVLQDATSNTLRGNVISGNGNNGVFVVGSTPTTDVENRIEENLIGTDATGTQDLGNTLMGVRLLRGTGLELRGNVISGNDNSNVLIDALGSDVLIADNLIGTDLTGNAPLRNPRGLPGFGVTLSGSNNRLMSNVISGNPRDGVVIDALNSSDGRGSGNVLQRNLIGVGADGSTSVPNTGNGIRIWRGARDNTIGTDGDGLLDATEGNSIAHNTGVGVLVMGAGSTGNSIRGNSIHSNGRLGIDLGGDGVTPNDNGDSTAIPPIPPDLDEGPNRLRNFPVLTSARSTQDTRVAGKVTSTPNTTFVVDFYASTSDELAGSRQGARWVGSVAITTNEFGEKGFSETVAAVEVGEYITATLTDPSGNTSEFSAPIVVHGRAGGGRPDSGGPASSTLLSNDATGSTSHFPRMDGTGSVNGLGAVNGTDFAFVRASSAKSVPPSVTEQVFAIDREGDNDAVEFPQLTVFDPRLDDEAFDRAIFEEYGGN